MVAHSVEKIALAENIDKNGIIMLEHGKFIVPSETVGQGKRYEVHFGSNNTLPQCTCLDWYRSPYLCKHFFAVFARFPSWSWDALSATYRNSPYMILDKFSDNSTVEANTTTGNVDIQILEDTKPDLQDGDADINDTKIDFATVLGQEKKIPSNDGPACRALLDDIKRLTFLIEDQHQPMKQLRDHLSSLRAEVDKVVPRERGIPLRKEETTMKTNMSQKENGRITALQHRKRKGKFSRRVGEKKEKAMKSMNFRINDGADEQMDVEEEIIMESCGSALEFRSTTKRIIDIESSMEANDNNESKTELRFQELIAKEKEESNRDMVLMEERKRSSIESFSITSAKQELDFSLNNVHEPLRQFLTAGGLRNVSHKKAIPGDVIAILQKMLRSQYAHADGLQDPLNGVKLKFRVYKKNPFVQVLHDGNYHWIAISTYHCQPGEVIYMDSLFSGVIAKHVKKQICSIIRYEKSPLTIKVIPVQQQRHFVDCGLFAVAFVQYVLHHNEYPSSVSFDQSKMRHHVLRAFAANKLDPFPTHQTTVKRNREKIIEIELYCSCRLPWSQGDNAKTNR